MNHLCLHCHLVIIAQRCTKHPIIEVTKKKKASIPQRRPSRHVLRRFHTNSCLTQERHLYAGPSVLLTYPITFPAPYTCEGSGTFIHVALNPKNDNKKKITHTHTHREQKEKFRRGTGVGLAGKSMGPSINISVHSKAWTSLFNGPQGPTQNQDIEKQLCCLLSLMTHARDAVRILLTSSQCLEWTRPHRKQNAHNPAAQRCWP